MYEFDSVSVSSFEASALAGKLSERSADGWDVLAVVNAGSDVIAYLRRSDASSTADAVEMVTPTETETVSEPQPVVEASAPATEPSSVGSGGIGWASSSSESSSPSTGDSSWGSGSGTWSGSAQQQAPAAAPAAVVTPQVPAGWYADPAGRFELRYWDGTAWTEHVSRAGQQSTDPPVA